MARPRSAGRSLEGRPPSCPSRSADFGDEIDLDAGVQRELRAVRRAHRRGLGAEDLQEQIGRAVRDEVVIGEAGGAVHEDGQLHEPPDASQVADRPVERTEEIDRDAPRRGGRLLPRDLRSDPAGPGDAVLLRDVAREEDQLARADRAEVRADGSRRRGEGDAERVEALHARISARITVTACPEMRTRSPASSSFSTPPREETCRAVIFDFERRPPQNGARQEWVEPVTGSSSTPAAGAKKRETKSNSGVAARLVTMTPRAGRCAKPRRSGSSERTACSLSSST